MRAEQSSAAPQAHSEIIVPSAIVERVIEEVAEATQRWATTQKDVLGAFFAASAANGELVVEPSTGRLLSDVEIGVVCRHPWRARSAVRAFGIDASRRFGIDVEPFTITERRLKLGTHKNQSLGRTTTSVLAYEIANRARWIFRKREIELGPVEVADLHPWEGARLLLNRIGEGAPALHAWDDVGQSADGSLDRWVLKLLLAAGDATLLATGRFAPSYSERGELWRIYGESISAEHGWADLVDAAYRARRQSRSLAKTPDREQVYEIFRTSLAMLLKASADWLSPGSAKKNDFQLLPDRLPTVFSTGAQALDPWYDNALRVPSIVLGGNLSSRAMTAWGAAGNFQHWAYAPFLAASGARSWIEMYDDAARSVGPYLKNNSGSTGEIAQRWWKYACK